MTGRKSRPAWRPGRRSRTTLASPPPSPCTPSPGRPAAVCSWRRSRRSASTGSPSPAPWAATPQ
ncbi:hypothetical protein E1261_30915 [Kribbella albertanoniae]|uniref:Uncharacterized protein n=1 Tax=Kribbella albertanoniae TaxID=1266829 RepID=A0A4R4PKJ9_9ACTN|nr:hypothetical protein E1261_30915 [Kribbella albertanoniae]